MKKTMLKAFILSLMISSIVTVNNAEAGTVKIINNSDLNLRVDVVTDPGSTSYCKSCYDGQTNICGKKSSEILVPADAFGGCGYFSLVDMSSGFLGSGSCKHLSVLKNYEVTFCETTLGTSCETREISK